MTAEWVLCRITTNFYVCMHGILTYALMLQVQLAAFLLGDSNASSTAMRSAAQLVQLLEPLPLPAKMAMSQCLPALPTGLPCMPLPASQVRSVLHESPSLCKGTPVLNIHAHGLAADPVGHTGMHMAPCLLEGLPAFVSHME